MSTFSRATNALLKAVNSVFGSDVLYTYIADGTTSDIKGVFDYSFIEVDAVISRKPTLKINLADLTASPVEGDIVEIDSVEYTVQESQPDTFGSSTLILRKI